MYETQDRDQDRNKNRSPEEVDTFETRLKRLVGHLLEENREIKAMLKQAIRERDEMAALYEMQAAAAE